MIQLDVRRLKRESIYHVFGTYEGEVTEPIRISPILPTRLIVQNVDSPTLDILSGPKKEGPFDSIGDVKKGRFELFDTFGLWFDIEFEDGDDYNFYAYVQK